MSSPHDDDDRHGQGTSAETAQPLSIGWRRLVHLGPLRHAAPSPLPPEYSSAPAKPPSRTDNTAASAPAPAAKPPKPSPKINLRASIAELLLISKLRARSLLGRHPAAALEAEKETERQTETARQREQKAVLACYARVLEVTCKNWFPEEATRNRQSPSPYHQRRL